MQRRLTHSNGECFTNIVTSSNSHEFLSSNVARKVKKRALKLQKKLLVVNCKLLIGFQDTGKRTQLSCLGVPA